MIIIIRLLSPSKKEAGMHEISSLDHLAAKLDALTQKFGKMNTTYLPQMFTKSQNFFTQTIPYITPNIIHQSKTSFIHPNHNSRKVLYPINLIQTPQILHQPTPLNSQFSLKHQPHN